MAHRNLLCFAMVAVFAALSACAFEDVPTAEPGSGVGPAPSSAGDSGAGQSSVVQALTTGKHPPCAPNVASCVDMYFVAHPDDNLLFMNPDIATSIHNGNHVVTVHLTSGSAGDDQETLIGRERGILNAYAFMVNQDYAATVANTANFDSMLAHWQLHGGMPITISTPHYSKQAIQYDFVGAPLSLVFLRINQQGTSDANGHHEDLEALWGGNNTVVRTTACSSECLLDSELGEQTYQDGHAELIEVLAALMNQFHTSVPGSQLVVNTQDSSGQGVYWATIDYGTGWFEYPDHPFGANFVISAFHRFHTYPGNDLRSLREYRDYNIGQELPNLGASEVLDKQLAFARYELGVGGTRNQYTPDYCSDLQNPEYCIWTQRKYATVTLASANLLRGRLMNQAGGQCLRIDNNILRTGNCSDAPEWQITTRNEIKLSSDPTQCIQLSSSNTFFVGTCLPVSAAEAQTLVLTSNGQIRARNATCLQGAGTQIWATLCLGILENSNPLRLPTFAQNWTLLFSDPSLISTQFSDGSGVENQRSYYRTIAIADGQVCLRQAGGVGCAAYNGAGGTAGPPSWSLATFALWPQSNPAEYADTSGWLADSSGSTMSFRHLSASGELSACGRGVLGMRCGRPQAATWWTTEFSNFDGWDANSTYYGSLRLADINGDGNADVCGRSEFGVRCLTGTGSSFANDTIWTTLYGSGWSFGHYGETLQFGDIDGDGRDDVCGRGSYGMYCAKSSSGQFVDDHIWSMSEHNTGLTENSVDFGDADPEGAWSTTAGRYRSIRMVDINRDGLVDVCGRSVNGIYCALSTGTAFEMKRNVMPFNFGGPIWDLEQYGSTIAFGNLDGDARVDMCLRGMFGMMCSEAW